MDTRPDPSRAAPSADDLLQQGRDQLARGAWTEARTHFEAALRAGRTPEALEQLGVACAALNDAQATIGAREEAFRLYSERGDLRGAARLAVWLADDYTDFRGDHAVANGWLQQGIRLIEYLPPCYEVAFVKLMAAHVALIGGHDPQAALRLAAEARGVVSLIQDPDLGMMLTAVEGLAMVSEGSVAAGMSLLDEATATATAGQGKDLTLIGTTCCYMINACERVRDYDRAGQWCDRVKDFCRRWRIGSLFTLCRMRYATLLVWRGEWTEAEEELATAAEELEERRPGLASVHAVRLGELRRRQGRFAEARELFTRGASHPNSLLGLGALALDEANPTTAIDFAERYLRRIPSAARAERVQGLELLLRAQVSHGQLEPAREILAELRETVRLVRTGPLQAAARCAEGVAAAAAGDSAGASDRFEDAIDLYEQMALPYESAEARLALARTLVALGRDAAALTELTTALATSRKLGAGFLERSITALLETRFAKSVPDRKPGARGRDVLTLREKEVLQQVAQGKDNEQIAETLFLSIRTVERHTSNIYQKLGLTGKSARVAAAAYALTGRL